MQNESDLQKYLNINTVSQTRAIPHQGKFTFISNTTGIPQAWTLNSENKPVKFCNSEDRITNVYHSPNGQKAIIGMDYEGNEKQQLYLVNEGSAQAKKLVYSPDFFHHFGGWSPDNKHIFYSSNRRSPGFFDVFVKNIESGEEKLVFQYDGNCIPLSWGVDENTLLISIRKTNIDRELYILNIKTGQKTRIGDPHTLARYRSPQLLKNGKGGYILTDEDEETLYLGYFSMESPNEIKKVIHFNDWDIDNFLLSPNNENAIFTLNEGGVSKLYTYDLHEKDMQKLNGLEQGVITSPSWLDNKQFVFVLKTPTFPGDCWYYSKSTKEFKRLTYIGETSPEIEFVKPNIYTFKSFDDMKIPYFYYEGKSNKDNSVVVYVHGGPESQTKAEYNPIIQYLVNCGISVAAPNIRGSSGYGRTYIKMDDARKRMDAVKDLAFLAEDLKVNQSVEPSKIGIMGRSYGGYMVLSSLAHYPDIWAAGISIVGLSNIKTFLKNTGPWRRKLREFEYGKLEENAEFFDEIAPLNNSHKIKAPLLLFHGQNDTRVPVSEAIQLAHDLKSRKQDVEMVIFDDEGHQTTKSKNKLTESKKVITFFQRHLNK